MSIFYPCSEKFGGCLTNDGPHHCLRKVQFLNKNCTWFNNNLYFWLIEEESLKNWLHQIIYLLIYPIDISIFKDSLYEKKEFSSGRSDRYFLKYLRSGSRGWTSKNMQGKQKKGDDIVEHGNVMACKEHAKKV